MRGREGSVHFCLVADSPMESEFMLEVFQGVFGALSKM
jgi:hypothetical protein